MSNPDSFWFHCGRCGSLFQSHPGDLDGRLCANCGSNPSLGIVESQPTPAPPTSENSAASAAQAGKKKGKRTGKGGKQKYLMLKIIAGWSAVLILILVAAHHFWGDNRHQNNESQGNVFAAAIDSANSLFLQTAAPKCMREFSGFLSATTPEEQNQFVLSAAATASRMARYYNSNPLIKVDKAGIKLDKQVALNLPEGKALETLWHCSDGRIIDAVFREEKGEWKLDWDHFIRYSNDPWALFLSGGGDDEGEFRLLARERLADERKNAETVSLVLYAPRFGNPGDVGFQSPEFLIPRKSVNGKLLDAAFKMDRRGEKVFRSSLPNLNPDGMIRVHVKIRRTEVEGERKFEITQVVACHWYSVDDPGVVPTNDDAVSSAPAPGTAPVPQPH